MVASPSVGREECVEAATGADADTDSDSADDGDAESECAWSVTVAAAVVSGASGEASESTGSSRREVELIKAARQRCASRMHGACNGNKHASEGYNMKNSEA